MLYKVNGEWYKSSSESEIVIGDAVKKRYDGTIYRVFSAEHFYPRIFGTVTELKENK